MNSSSSAIIIGDRVVSKYMDNCIRITPIKWIEKKHSLIGTETLTLETKVEEAKIIHELADGLLSFDDLIKTYF